MKLTHDNYHSAEANREYLSASQIKAFRTCQYGWLKEYRPTAPQPSEEEKTRALLIGSYVDCAVLTPDDLPAFVEKYSKELHNYGKPEKGKNKDVELADIMAEAVLAQPLAKRLIDSCEKQVILTGDIMGMPFKGMLDGISATRIIDLKTTRDLFALNWCDRLKRRVSFIEEWDYWTQFAIYRMLAGMNGYKIEEMYIVAVDKVDPPAARVFDMSDDNNLGDATSRLVADIREIQVILAGHSDPERCGQCKHCRVDYIQTEPIRLTDDGRWEM